MRQLVAKASHCGCPFRPGDVGRASETDADQLERLLTAEAVAEPLRVPPSTVYELTHTRRLPFLKVGRCTRFERRALLDWIAAQTVRPKD